MAHAVPIRSLRADSLLHSWEQVFVTQGRVPHHDPMFVRASARRETSAVMVVSEDGALFSAFANTYAGAWRCLLQGDPILGPHAGDPARSAEFVRGVLEELDASTLFFPLVYGDARSSGALAELDAVRWQRLPSPWIDWRRGGADLWGRVCTRLGREGMMRNRRRFEQRLRCRRVASAEAIAAVGEVEARSWKARAGLDMRSTDHQFDYYTELIENDRVEVALAWDGDRPVAHRIDKRVGDTVFALKSSFDDEYRRLAPGLFLCAIELHERWRDEDVSRVDLFGSPNPMLSALATGVRERFEAAWPRCLIAESIRAERVAYDTARAAHLRTSRGVRYSV